VHTLSKRL
jgi:hypothetical protein